MRNTKQVILACVFIVPSLFSFVYASAAPPLIDQWEQNMLTDGVRVGEHLTQLFPDPGTFSESNMTYYDSQRVFYQIAEYTGQQEPWHSYAQEAKRIYLNYVENRINNWTGLNYSFPGYRRFPHGIYMDWVLNPTPALAESIIKLRDNPAYSNPEQIWFQQGLFWSNRSRDLAYALGAHVVAERANNPRNEERVALYVAMTLNHINEWVTGFRGNPDVSRHRFAPFMAGLTAEALIGFYEWEIENDRDPSALYSHPSVPTEYTPTMTIPEALQGLADFMWTATVQAGEAQGESMWVADIGGTGYPYNDLGGTGVGGFRYEDRLNPISGGDTTERVSPDLNLLIAPLYGWLFKHTGDTTYITRGDLIWEGGVTLANTGWQTKNI